MLACVYTCMYIFVRVCARVCARVCVCMSVKVRVMILTRIGRVSATVEVRDGSGLPWKGIAGC